MDAVQAFGSLGDSWKKRTSRSPGGRRLHGRAGEGRFSGFALGRDIRWTTRWRPEAAVLGYEILGSLSDPGAFEITEPTAQPTSAVGTEVTVSELHRSFASLRPESAIPRLAEVFALYLRDYPGIQIVYDGLPVEPQAVEDSSAEYDVTTVRPSDGLHVSARLTVIEWKHKVDRALLFCDAGGFSLASRPAGIHAPGFEFTAYLKSDYIRQLEAEHLLDLDELHPDLAALVEAARATMRDHFRRRAADRARAVVDEWKAQRIYPYTGVPQNVVEEVERQVFDVVALNLHSYLPDFASSDSRTKKFSLHMLKTSIEQSPAEVQRIIQEVLDLPKDKQEELASLLERTSLSAIISAARLVADRLDFLMGLDILIFDSELKERTKERRHIHRLLAENTWIFGEEFNLTVDDESLNRVLEQHLALLGREPLESPAGVQTAEGQHGIIDLMLSRRVPRTRAEELEHIVAELKRPTRRIDTDAVTQIKKYASAIATDERFRDVSTRWTFWLVSNQISDDVRWEIFNQRDRPDGMLLQLQNPHLTIWAKTWGQLISDCRGRLEFFRERLQYMVNRESGLEHLRRTYAKYIPQEKHSSP